MPDEHKLQEMQRERAIVKSCTELERLFKVDIVQVSSSLSALTSKLTTKVAADQEIELQLHFVNKARNPYELPVLKRFTMKADEAGKKFLAQFESVAKQASAYYN